MTPVAVAAFGQSARLTLLAVVESEDDGVPARKGAVRA